MLVECEFIPRANSDSNSTHHQKGAPWSRFLSVRSNPSRKEHPVYG